MPKNTNTNSFDPYDFEQKVIDGVPVYYKKFPTAPCIHINICFNNGVLNDPKDKAGISHFLEHMIFDGSPKLLNKKIIKEWSKINALNSWNAWTFFGNTNYHLKCLPEKFNTVLDGMEDMIFRPLLREEDVEHERNVITQEAWGVYKNEKLLNFLKSVLKNIYSGTTREISYSPLGWPDTIAKITQKDLKEWHERNYGRGNFFIVLSGNINESHIKNINEFIHRLPKVKNQKPQFGKINKPNKLFVTKNSDDIGDPREQVEISFERVILPKQIANEEIQQMAGALLSDILFERLRTERALCYSVYAGSFIQKDFIIWSASLRTKEKEIATVKKEFWKALNDITSGKEKKRFDVLKQVRIDKLKSLEEVTDDFTKEALSNVWRHGKIISKKQMLTERSKIKYSDVVKCLKLAFDKSWTVTEVILPSKK